MFRRASLPLLVAIVMVPAAAHDPESIAIGQLRSICQATSISPQDCAVAEDVVRATFSGTRRVAGGVSYEDARNENEQEHARIEVEIGSFYFAPRVLEVDVGQIVTFRNVSPFGGNPHIVSSSDWPGSERAFPVPGSLSWGGGSFTSGVMEPGDTWDWPMEISTEGNSGVSLGIDKVLIPYHCNLHGASQMNGFLLLRTREY